MMFISLNRIKNVLWKQYTRKNREQCERKDYIRQILVSTNASSAVVFSIDVGRYG